MLLPGARCLVCCFELVCECVSGGGSDNSVAGDSGGLLESFRGCGGEVAVGAVDGEGCLAGLGSKPFVELSLPGRDGGSGVAGFE